MALLTVNQRSVQSSNVFNSNSAQGGAKLALAPTEEKTKLRIVDANYKNTTGGTIAIGQIISLLYIPNPCIIIPHLSNLQYTAFGASATVDLGWQEYVNATTGAIVLDNITGIKAAQSVAAAGNYVLNADAADWQLQGTNRQGGIPFFGQTEILMRIGGAAMPTNAEVKLSLALLIE